MRKDTYPLELNRAQLGAVRSIAADGVSRARNECKTIVQNAYSIEAMLEATAKCMRNYTEAELFRRRVGIAIDSLDNS